jgi:hypothetical protein
VRVIATVLDPRKKEAYLDFFFKNYCEDVDHIQKAMDSISKTIRLYYDLYEVQVKRSNKHSVPREATWQASLLCVSYSRFNNVA